jgi:hypothetical protein
VSTTPLVEAGTTFTSSTMPVRLPLASLVAWNRQRNWNEPVLLNVTSTAAPFGMRPLL